MKFFLEPQINEGLAFQLSEMGFPIEGCRKAVYHTQNSGKKENKLILSIPRHLLIYLFDGINRSVVIGQPYLTRALSISTTQKGAQMPLP